MAQHTIITATTVYRVEAKNYHQIKRACDEVGIVPLSITNDADSIEGSIGERMRGLDWSDYASEGQRTRRRKVAYTNARNRVAS